MGGEKNWQFYFEEWNLKVPVFVSFELVTQKIKLPKLRNKREELYFYIFTLIRIDAIRVLFL